MDDTASRKFPVKDDNRRSVSRCSRHRSNFVNLLLQILWRSVGRENSKCVVKQSSQQIMLSNMGGSIDFQEPNASQDHADIEL